MDAIATPVEEFTTPPRYLHPPSRRLNRKVSEYQRRISVKELRHVIVDRSSQSAIAHEQPVVACEDSTTDEEGSSRKCTRRTGTEHAISAKQLSSLIEKRTKEKRRNIVEKFISALTLHGYAEFHEASGIRKILWALILTAMTLFIVRLTYLSYRSENFYKQVIELETEKVSELDFPTITICSYLPVFTDEMLSRFPINITKVS